jgi:hypothetical protein
MFEVREDVTYKYEAESKSEMNLLITLRTTICDCKLYHFSTKSPPFLTHFVLAVHKPSNVTCEENVRCD